MQFQFEQMSSSAIYHLVTQTLIPRPIAWVLTDSGTANYNLAPFSYFSAISSAPPLLLLSIGQKPTGEEKDTFINLTTGSKAVVHISNEQQYKEVTKSAATLPHGESEVTQNKLELTDFKGFDLPRLADCSIAFGCKLYQTNKINGTQQNVVFLEIEQLFVDDKLISYDDKDRISVDAKLVQPLARLGANQYATLGEVISQSRPK